MNIEIERKYLIKDLSFRDSAHRYLAIKQGYLSTDKDRSVRVRVLDQRGFLTIKGRSSEDGLSRYEWEKEIAKDEALELLKLTLPGRIEKVRYLVNYADHMWEVDVFEGINKGLILAEIELSSEKEHFELPPFIGQEVTGDVRYYNAYISKYPFNTWK